MEFNVINEDNNFKIGNILSVFTIPESDRNMVLFSLEDYDVNDENSLHVAYLNTDINGYDYITEIDDEKIFKKALLVARDLLGGINNG